MTRSLRSIAVAAGLAVVLLLAPAVRGASTDDELGRWKLDGNGGCYWDENDDGPDQCDPNNPDGRYKLDGNGGCYWDPYDFGDDQCTPGQGGSGDLTALDEGGDTQGSGNCIGSLQSMALASKGTFDGNQLNVTVSIDPALSVESAEGIRAAALAWNNHTGTTKVHFDVVGSSGGDLHFWRRDAGANGGVAGTFNNWHGCAEASPASGRPNITKDVNDKNNRGEIAPVAGHELGHNLGISHTSPGTSGLMAQLGFNILHPIWGLHAEDCNDILRDRALHGSTATTVEASDVQKAVECLSQMWSGRTFQHYGTQDYQKQIPQSMGGGYCVETWNVEFQTNCTSATSSGGSFYMTCTGVNVVKLGSSPVSSSCPPGI